MGFGVYDRGGGKWDYDEISEYWKTCGTLNKQEDLDNLTIDFMDWWIGNYVDIPMFWQFAKAAINPEIVESYEVNMLHVGVIRYHEYTVPVFK